jgi:hypothetical protein
LNGLLVKLQEAIGSFFEQDADLLTLEVNERTITGSLAYHIRRTFIGWHVDVEYNRLGDEIKRIPVASCLTNDTDGKTIYPDIVVHKRGARENLIVIEVKKANNHDTENDYIKLEELSDPNRNFGYKLGIHLIFDCQKRKCSRSQVWTNGNKSVELSAKFNALLSEAKLSL